MILYVPLLILAAEADLNVCIDSEFAELFCFMLLFMPPPSVPIVADTVEEPVEPRWLSLLEPRRTG